MEEIRYKSIVVPYFVKNNKKQFVVVQDSKYKELTFPGGGCKKYETNPYNSVNSPEITLEKGLLKCAQREFREETRGVFGRKNLSDFKYQFSFYDTKRSNTEKEKNKIEKVRVTMVYAVYFVNLGIIRNFESYKRKFQTSSSINNETDNIFAYEKHILNKKNVWKFMKNRLLPII